MTGFIFLDKPEGITSFTAVNKVRRICSVKKAGHTGTLDPMATGVLPIMLSGATRFSQYLPTHDKSYRAKILLGTVTDTLDTTGKILKQNEVSVTDEDIINIIPSFIGDIKQLPPMYSAVSKDGVRLYKLARSGIEVEREARCVTVHKIEIISGICNCEFEIEVSCSAGTYIRSLASDIGDALGCGAAISALRRTSANGIDISQTVTIDELEALASAGELESVLHSCDEMLGVYPEIHISEKQSVRFSNGGELDANRIKGDLPDGICRVYSPDNELLGLGKHEEGIIKIEKLLVR
ncbi:MAG: tRNA pseudouridine(55) synthase TruB [Clostridia bacterium]|nr:tRNA pseudouridine(55) synthase TruB [Clostridia bacterium]